MGIEKYNTIRCKRIQILFRRNRFVLAGVFFCGFLPMLHASDVVIDIRDQATDHVHLAGKHFELEVVVHNPGTGGVGYVWRDWRGNDLTEPLPLVPGIPRKVTSPSLKEGYYGLVFLPLGHAVLPDRSPGEDREYGFAVLPPASKRRANYESPFGMVHTVVDDPYMPVWAKTLTWNTLSPRWWGVEIDKQMKAGVLELPIIVKGKWRSDDRYALRGIHLEELKDSVKTYMGAHPAVIYWELGLEENLQDRYNHAYYWSNLTKKIAAVKEIVSKINPEIKIIYQVAGTDLGPVEKFFQSKAAKLVDILSVHPYAWPDFPEPERWLPAYLKKIDRLRALYQIRHMPVWMTEAGAPHHGNAGFFGYPDSGARVKGLSRAGMVNYMVIFHVIALQNRVKKIFWYNYRDRRASRTRAEDHFGIKDYWGFPKPVYTAYIQLIRRLDGKAATGCMTRRNNLWRCRFEGKKQAVLVVWTFPSVDLEMSADDLYDDLDLNATRAYSVMGETIVHNGRFPVSGYPIYIQFPLKGR